MELEVQGRIPNLDDDGLREAAKRAEDICPVSNALRGNVEITVDTILEEE
jgi:osmotically inducible protein OsmC